MHNPPPCECEIWHYNQVNVDHIRKAVDVSLEKSITKSQHKRYIFCLFNKTVKHISNYIPHETATFDNRDPPGIKKKCETVCFRKKWSV